VSELDDVMYRIQSSRTGLNPLPTLATVERALILEAVTTLGVLPAAKELGISKTSIYRKLKGYGIKVQPSTLKVRGKGLAANGTL
jgi:transcriptional regulator of acetoin/glycerol metabolism